MSKSNDSTYHLDVHSSIHNEILSHLTKYKLRNAVTLEQTNHSVYQNITTNNNNNIMTLDPRHTRLGYRSIESSANLSTPATAATTTTESSYLKKRMQLCIPEFPSSIPANTLPLEHNLDLQNAIDFRKGCYLGQELTVRTHHTGIIRKRVVKLKFTIPPAKTGIQDILHEGKVVGQVYELLDTDGIGFLRLEYCDKQLELQDGSIVVACLPEYA